MSTPMRWARGIAVFCFAIGAFPDPAGAADAAEAFAVARDGKASCVLLADESFLRSRNGKRDAEELACWLKAITGGEFPVTSVRPADDGLKTIRLGLAREHPEIARQYGLETRGPDAVALHSAADELSIIGNSEAAIRNGIYTVLRDIGCRWYFPNPHWWQIPKKPSLDYTGRRVESPDFLFGRLFYGGGSANSISPWFERNRLAKQNEGYIAHSWNTRVPARTFFASHPEYFSLVQGQRKPSQLCVGNPEMRSLFIQNTLKFLREHPSWKVAPVEPNDNLGFCESLECKAIGNGSPCDHVFFLANEVARAIRKEYTDCYAGVDAYLNHAEPPSFPLESNLYVEVTTKLRFTRKSVDEVIREFRDRGVKVGVRDYLSIPQWNAGAVGGGSKGARYLETPQWVAKLGENGVVGYNGEAGDDWGIKGLTYYLVSCALWNHQTDLKAETDAFFQNMFGSTAPMVRGMYDRWQKKDLTGIEFVQDAVARLRTAYSATSDPAVHQRLDELGMLVYWNYLFYQLQQAAVVEGATGITLDSKGVFRRFIEWSARISPTGMVDAYAVVQVLGRFQGLKTAFPEAAKREGVELAPLYNSYNGTWWKEALAKGVPNHAEVQAAYVEMDAFFAPFDLPNGRQAIASTPRLVPLRDAHPEILEEWPKDLAKPSMIHVPAGVPVGVWARKGETVVLPYGLSSAAFDPKAQGSAEEHPVTWKVVPHPDRARIVATGGGKLARTAGQCTENGDVSGLPRASFQAPTDGVYLVSFDCPTYGTLMMRLTPDLKERPLALLPFLSEETAFRTVNPLVWSGVPSFLHLPTNCRQIVLVSTGAAADVFIKSADGKTVGEAKRFGAQALRRLPVQGAQGGRVVSLITGTQTIGVRNLPVGISPHPRQVLMVAEPEPSK